MAKKMEADLRGRSCSENRTKNREAGLPLKRLIVFEPAGVEHLPQRRKVAWSLLLQDDSEGRALIDYPVTHLENQLQRQLHLAGITCGCDFVVHAAGERR